MISGYVSSVLEAIVPVVLVDGNGHRWRQEVLVDTGFNGDLTLPVEVIDQLGLILVGQTAMTLANGQTVETNQYQATAIWDREQLTVDVMESENQYLLGTNLLHGRTVTVQMWAGGDVVIDYATPPSHPPP